MPLLFDGKKERKHIHLTAFVIFKNIQSKFMSVWDVYGGLWMDWFLGPNK